MTDTNKHFGRNPIRKAKFIEPERTLKRKVGSGGLNAAILDKAQAVIEENKYDFIPMAQKDLASLIEGYKTSEEMENYMDAEPLITSMLNPAMQLKANGGMFGYALISRICAKLVQFLEVLESIDRDALDVIGGFITALKALISGQVKGEGGKTGQELYNALNDACHRYFKSRY